MNDAALILVDLQNDFTPGGALAVPGSDEIIGLINRLQNYFKVVVATQDWHPPEHVSFAANHVGAHIGDQIVLQGLTQILWPIHCVQDTWGAAFTSTLRLKEHAQIFRKGLDPDVDSYSGFFDHAQRHETGLKDYLRKGAITVVYICGVATDYCVRFTALDAHRLGFDTLIIQDACRGLQHSLDAIEQMRATGIRIVQSHEVLSNLSRLD